MTGDEEGGLPVLQLLSKVCIGQTARPGPHLELGEGELHVQFLEIRQDQLRNGTRGHLGHHAPVQGQAGNVDNVES